MIGRAILKFGINDITLPYLLIGLMIDRVITGIIFKLKKKKDKK